MTSMVTMIRLLNAMQGGKSGGNSASSSVQKGLSSPMVAFQGPARAARRMTSFALAVGAGIFLGGLNESSLVLSETCSSVSHESSYDQVQLNEVPRSLDPRYRSFQE